MPELWLSYLALLRETQTNGVQESELQVRAKRKTMNVPYLKIGQVIDMGHPEVPTGNMTGLDFTLLQAPER